MGWFTLPAEFVGSLLGWNGFLPTNLAENIGSCSCSQEVWTIPIWGKPWPSRTKSKPAKEVRLLSLIPKRRKHRIQIMTKHLCRSIETRQLGSNCRLPLRAEQQNPKLNLMLEMTASYWYWPLLLKTHTKFMCAALALDLLNWSHRQA